MLGVCIGEILSVEVVLSYGATNLSKCPVLTPRHLCGVLLQENDGLSQLEGRRFITFFLLHHRLMTAGRVRLKKTMGLNSMG